MTSPPAGSLARRPLAHGDAPQRVPASEPERIVRVRSPAQLVNLVPYLLGFQPVGGDMVVLGTALPGYRVQLTLRWPLPGPDAPVLAAAQARDAVAVLVAEECTQIAVVGFGPGRLVTPSITPLRQAAETAGLGVWDLLRADGGRYWSYQCDDPSCCPPGGTSYSPHGDPVAAAYEAAGVRVLASRDVLAATIAPASGADAGSMREAFLRAAQRSARNTAREIQRRAAGKESRPHATAEHRAVKTAITTYRAGGSITSHDELAWLALALARTPVRDLAWTLMDPAHRQAHLRLWTELIRLAVPGLEAAPASLLALCAWQDGNGALARIALDRALDDDPGYPMARLLRDALDRAAPPYLADPAYTLQYMQAATGDRHRPAAPDPRALPGHP